MELSDEPQPSTSRYPSTRHGFTPINKRQQTPYYSTDPIGVSDEAESTRAISPAPFAFSSTISSTPPTSQPESPILPSPAPKGDLDRNSSPRRVLRARKSLVGTYNVSQMARRKFARVGSIDARLTTSDKSSSKVVDTTNDPSTLPDSTDNQVQVRKSSRIQLVAQKVGNAVKDTASALEATGKSLLGITKGANKTLVGSLKRSAATVFAGSDASDGPIQKKAKPSSPPLLQASPAKRLRAKDKKFLSQGLYVGQDRDFDPRLTESKNKEKSASKKLDTNKQKQSFMPLPMFAGERLLEEGREFSLPFDVFCPFPRQPKPADWKKTQKNVFFGDAADLWKDEKLEEISKCVCKPESGCAEDCQNRSMFYECDDTNCAIGHACTNRPFHDLKLRQKWGNRYTIGVEIVKTSDKGFGIRSNRTFKPGQIIMEYAGEIITQEESERRMKKVYKKDKAFYMMLFDQNMIIDATRGNMARFINHSCEPNCKMVKWNVKGKPRMALFAGEDGIMTGEELTYDYNFDPFSGKNVQVCCCGSEKCRGIIGPRPKEPPKPKQSLLGSAIASGKRKFKQLVGNGISSASNPNKKLKTLQANPKTLDTQPKSKMPLPLALAASSTGGLPGRPGRASKAHTIKSTRLVKVKPRAVKSISHHKKTKVPEKRTQPKRSLHLGMRRETIVEIEMIDDGQVNTSQPITGDSSKISPKDGEANDTCSSASQTIGNRRRSMRIGKFGAAVKTISADSNETLAYQVLNTYLGSAKTKSIVNVTSSPVRTIRTRRDSKVALSTPTIDQEIADLVNNPGLVKANLGGLAKTNNGNKSEVDSPPRRRRGPNKKSEAVCSTKPHTPLDDEGEPYTRTRAAKARKSLGADLAKDLDVTKPGNEDAPRPGVRTRSSALVK
ncbi:MAG: hypothetical protein M1829_000932 [Trizodia sp. TS-e1964]|nr:MAG: hypothetical protein M1829_000932 [Trizodia sp. TS-e1964]